MTDTWHGMIPLKPLRWVKSLPFGADSTGSACVLGVTLTWWATSTRRGVSDWAPKPMTVLGEKPAIWAGGELGRKRWAAAPCGASATRSVR